MGAWAPTELNIAPPLDITMRLHFGQLILWRSPNWVLLDDAPLAISPDDQGAADGERRSHWTGLSPTKSTNQQRMGMGARVLGLGIGIEKEMAGEHEGNGANGHGERRWPSAPYPFGADQKIGLPPIRLKG